MEIPHQEIKFEPADLRAVRLLVAFDAILTAPGVATMTPARARKWKRLYVAGFDADDRTKSNSVYRYYLYRPTNQRRMNASTALLVAEAIAETKLECSLAAKKAA